MSSIKNIKSKLFLGLIVSLAANSSWLWETKEDVAASLAGHYILENQELASENAAAENKEIDITNKKVKVTLYRTDPKDETKKIAFFEGVFNGVDVLNFQKGADQVNTTSNGCSCSVANPANNQPINEENKKNVDEAKKVAAELAAKAAEEENKKAAAAEKEDEKAKDDQIAEDESKDSLDNFDSKCSKIKEEDKEFRCKLSSFENLVNQKKDNEELNLIFNDNIKSDFENQIDSAIDYKEIKVIQKQIAELLKIKKIRKNSKITRALQVLKLESQTMISKIMSMKLRNYIDENKTEIVDTRKFIMDEMDNLDGYDPKLYNAVIADLSLPTPYHFNNDPYGYNPRLNSDPYRNDAFNNYFNNGFTSQNYNPRGGFNLRDQGNYMPNNRGSAFSQPQWTPNNFNNNFNYNNNFNNNNSYLNNNFASFNNNGFNNLGYNNNGFNNNNMNYGRPMYGQPNQNQWGQAYNSMYPFPSPNYGAQMGQGMPRY